ncbi:MAG: hypothetical protein WCP19_10800, partial [Chloroflexota bacterium]
MILILFLVNACNSIQTDSVLSPVLSPTGAVLTPLPPQALGLAAIPKSILPSPQPQAEGDLFPAYKINALMDYDAGIIDAEQDIKFTNNMHQALPDILLAVQPDRIPGVFVLQELVVDQTAIADYQLSGQKLQFSLKKPLQPGEKISIFLKYRLNLPYLGNGTADPNWPRFFGIQSRQVNLTDWYPMLVPFRGQAGWQLSEPQPIGEHLVYPLANFDLTLKFTNPDALPVIAASSIPVKDDGTYHFVLDNARDFALSMGRRFELVTAEVNGVSINSYYFPGNRTAGLAALDASKKAVELYSNLFGAYHHNSLAVVQCDFDDGKEHDGLFYLSNNF